MRRTAFVSVLFIAGFSAQASAALLLEHDEEGPQSVDLLSLPQLAMITKGGQQTNKQANSGKGNSKGVGKGGPSALVKGRIGPPPTKGTQAPKGGKPAAPSTPKANSLLKAPGPAAKGKATS